MSDLHAPAAKNCGQYALISGEPEDHVNRRSNGTVLATLADRVLTFMVLELQEELSVVYCRYLQDLRKGIPEYDLPWLEVHYVDVWRRMRARVILT